MEGNTNMRKSKRTVVVGVAALGLIGGGIAFAAWTSTGTDTGTATATSEAGLKVEVENISNLYPSGTYDMDVTVTNNNPYAVQLDAVTFDGVVSDADLTGCGPEAVGATIVDDFGDRLEALGGLDSTVKTFTVEMDADADSGCQGAEFTLTFGATGHSIG